jgi:hypothetical protein
MAYDMYGPMRLTHKHSQGLLMMVFGGRCLYLSFCLLLVWQDLQDLVIDRMVVRIPFQYITAFIVSSRHVCPGCRRLGWYHLTARTWSGFGITSRPTLQTHVVFSMSLISIPWSTTVLHLKMCFRDASACKASAISTVIRGYSLGVCYMAPIWIHLIRFVTSFSHSWERYITHII